MSTETLYKLSDLSPVRNWNYSKPTLVKLGRYTGRKMWRESSNFWVNFIKLYPVFEELSLDKFAIAGGCIVDLLFDWKTKDIDMYYITDVDNELLAKSVESFVSEIIEWMKQKNAETNKKIEK